MRKFTFFLSLVVAFITATAQEVTVTSLDQLSNDKTYFIESARCFLMNNTTANAAGISTSNAKNLGASTVTKDWNDVNQQFKIENIDGNYYLYSVGAAKYVTKDGSWSDDAIDALSMTPSSDNTYNWKFVIGGNGMNSQEPGQLDAGIVVNNWTTEDAGNRYKIIDTEASTVVVVDYPNEFAEFDQNKCYTVTTTSRGGWAVKDDQFCSTTDASLGDTSNPNDANQQFAILSVDGENYYIYSVGAQKFVNSDGSLVAGVAEPIELADASKVGDCRVRVNFKGYTDKYINLGGEKQMTIDDWSDIDAGNAVAFIKAGEFDPTAALAMLAPQEPEPEVPALEITGYTPTEAVEKLETITITFNDEIEGTFDMMAMSQIYLGSRSNGCSFAVEGNVLTITPFNAITTPGEYGIVIPEGLITRKVNGEKISLNKEITFTVKEAIAALEITGYTPTEAVEKLETITITFNDEIEGTFDMMAMTQIYLGSRSNGCSFAVEGNVLTITPFNAITTPGEYGIVIPEGLITRKVNGEKISLNKEITFTVKEAIVEPEPETPAVLNETVVFDFANNVWGIEGPDPASFAGTKTAGEYTDGTKTIYIDPTANKGQFYYENGYLRIQKPGSKIVLPAFDFAVEKIEVIGHASATSYPSVDMNVYVGSTAVSTACIGSTETYIYEIAADKQAAGNIYELVIGSNGGNYSSVMFITYVKVYPAENKLEAPAFDLASGVYVGEQTVNVHSATTDLEGVTDVTYYYTTDGNEPTVEDEETDGEITITESCTLKVIVEFTYGDKVYVSASSSAEYIITEEVTYHRAVAVESGSYFIVADGNVSTPINGTTLMAKETSVSGDDVTEALYYAITLEETESGYYIKDVNGNYIYNTMMSPNKLTHNTAAPMDAWTIEIADDENSTAMIVCNGYALALQNGVFCAVHIDDVANAVLPTFYGTHATGINEAVVNGEAIESIYDLQGRMIEKVTNGGIYIVNGKKVLVK